jgi:hypothetical protein
MDESMTTRNIDLRALEITLAGESPEASVVTLDHETFERGFSCDPWLSARSLRPL